MREMTSESGKKPAQPARRTFIEEARRSQIVACALDVIAEEGYGRASLARIAARAGISKGVISYHFADKDELMMQAIVAVYTDAAVAMGTRIQAQTTAPAALRASIETNLAAVVAWPMFAVPDDLRIIGP